MSQKRGCQKKLEKLPEVVRIRKIYDIMLWGIIVVVFILGPIYLVFAVYYPQWLF